MGGGGDNVIIGDGGGDTIHGGGGSDLLIAGSTTFDTNAPAHRAILQAWATSTVTVAHRIAALRAGVPYAVGGQRAMAALTAQTVLGDDPMCQLMGSRGVDWFWAVNPRGVLDLQTGAAIN
jgi:Ca2+-binding RTX toxin-like protein